jgi:hypothetical protein
MEKNVGGYDRIARLILGPLLIVVAAAAFGGYLPVLSGLVGAAAVWAVLLVGVVFVVTGATQVCPLNRALGVDTYRGKSPDATDSDSEPRTGRPT